MLLPSFLTSVEVYLAEEERSETKHEYVGGAVFPRVDETSAHAFVVVNAIGALGRSLKGKPCRPFTSDAKIRIEYPNHTRFYYPDAQVVRLQNPGNDHYQDRPVLVVEVLSDSTRRIDSIEKRDAYLTIPSLGILLLVEFDRPYVLAYRRRAEGGFAAEEWRGTEGVIPLPEIEAELSLADLYEDIAFSAASA